jgi:outer membrane protein OmpA-like peptidoglycan-associated protein
MKTLARALTVGLALCANPAHGDDPAARGFDADTIRPALGMERGLAVETASAEHAGNWAVGLRLDWLRGFLALTANDRRDQLLDSRLTGHLMAVRAFRWFELAADLPVVIQQRADFSLLTAAGVTGPLMDPVAARALGDLRFTGKVPLLAADRFPVGLAALADLRLPTGDGSAFASDGLRFAPAAVVTRPVGPVRLDAQLGYVFRKPGQFAQLVVHDGIEWGLGASAGLPALGKVKDWRAHVELVGGWPRGNDLETARYRAPLAAAAGLRVGLSRSWQLELGGSTGLGAPGYGRESWRVFVGIRFARVGVDTDGDGVYDDEDLCPKVPGPKDLLGCPEGSPELDADHDGVLLPLDLCPDAPGSPEMDGCPDADFDFIPDYQDKCPDEPGPATNDGCPVLEEPLVSIEADKLSLKDAINFETGKATILPRSDRILDSIAELLKANAGFDRIRVEGHTDNVGSSAYNKDLSQRRAQAVVEALVKRGIPGPKLLPVGYGFDRPVDSNVTALGRAKNRRVEFTILQPGEGAEK